MMTIPECHFLCCTSCCLQAPGPGFIYVGYFILSSLNPPVSLTFMPRNEHRVFPFYNLYMQKIHPSQECPFHPQEESGATWLIDTTSPETEKAIWLKGKNEWKLLSRPTAKVLCHMKLILWGQQLESGYSPYIILPANYVTQYLFHWARWPAMTSKSGLGGRGKGAASQRNSHPFLLQADMYPRSPTETISLPF